MPRIPGRALATLETRRLFAAAARQNPAAAARLDDLDLDARILFVRGKGRRKRIGHLGAGGCLAAVSAWIRTRGDRSSPLLRAVHRGSRVLEGACPRAPSANASAPSHDAPASATSPPHLRRSFATALLDAGCDLALAADFVHVPSPTSRPPP